MRIKTDNSYLQLILNEYARVSTKNIYVITSPNVTCLFWLKGLHKAKKIYAPRHIIRILSGLYAFRECCFYDIDLYGTPRSLVRALKYNVKKKTVTTNFSKIDDDIMNLSCHHMPINVAKEMGLNDRVIYAKISRIKKKLGVKSNIEYITACLLRKKIMLEHYNATNNY
ncbi:TPA: hypothetical protein L7672_003235 [Klebsiella pneumoniae subsp. pneumoniae]|nr:hypothetical protein [Klebsiella pneumoniae subsp. pneumoniae]